MFYVKIHPLLFATVTLCLHFDQFQRWWTIKGKLYILMMIILDSNLDKL